MLQIATWTFCVQTMSSVTELQPCLTLLFLSLAFTCEANQVSLHQMLVSSRAEHLKWLGLITSASPSDFNGSLMPFVWMKQPGPAWHPANTEFFLICLEEIWNILRTIKPSHCLRTKVTLWKMARNCFSSIELENLKENVYSLLVQNNDNWLW